MYQYRRCYTLNSYIQLRYGVVVLSVLQCLLCVRFFSTFQVFFRSFRLQFAHKLQRLNKVGSLGWSLFSTNTAISETTRDLIRISGYNQGGYKARKSRKQYNINSSPCVAIYPQQKLTENRCNRPVIFF